MKRIFKKTFTRFHFIVSYLFFCLLISFTSFPIRATIVIDSPYVSKAYSYKGQVHTHTTQSDGDASPYDAVTIYKNAGYDFVSLTDHISEPWVPDDKKVITKNPGVTGILFIPGTEQTTSYGATGDIVWLNAAIKETNPWISPQEMIDVINKNNGISILAHPWAESHGMPNSILDNLKNYTGVETYSHQEVWDRILSSGKKVWGFSVSDCHNYSDINCMKKFIRVSANDLNVEEILKNIKNGNFYSARIVNKDFNLKVSVSDGNIIAATDIGTTIEFIGINGNIKKRVLSSKSVSFSPNGSEKYIRVKAKGSDGSLVWSNPLFISQVTPTITLTVKPIVTPIVTIKIGDANGDNKADLIDFSIWKKEYLNNQIEKADFNNDKKIDLVDFSVWKNSYLN